MYEFLDRLINVALPRVRDFKGVSNKAFDGNGNYTLGIREQIIFPEINYDQIEKVKGLNISIVTTARNDEQGSRCCATSACRSGSKESPTWQSFRKLPRRSASRSSRCASTTGARSAVAPRVPAQVPDVPHLPPQARAEGEITGLIKSSW